MRGRNRSRNRGHATSARSFWGIDGFDSSTALTTATNAGVLGATGVGVSVVIVFSVDALPTGTQRFAYNRPGNSGWFMQSNGSNLEFSAGTGAALAQAPTKTLGAGDVNKVLVAALTSDASAIYLYFNRAQNGTSTSMSGYTAPSGTQMALGSQPGGGNPAVNYRIHGITGRDSHLTLADFQTICDASKAANTLALGGVSMSHMWRAPPPPMPSTLADTIGADTMSFTTGVAANLNISGMPIAWGF